MTSGPPVRWSNAVKRPPLRERPPFRRRGFTLVEALVTIVLVALALVGVFSGIRAVTATEARAKEADLLQRLAAQKFSEFGPVTDPNTAEDSGDFTEEGYPDISWTVEVEPGEIVDVTRVTVTASRSERSQAVTGLVYVRPLTGGTP